MTLGRWKRLTRQAVDVGWLLEAKQGSFIWEEPRSARRSETRAMHAKSLGRCPAVNDQEGRLFEISCPVDLILHYSISEKGQPTLSEVSGLNTAVRMSHLMNLVFLADRSEWRHPDRPVVQINTPYRFVADEEVYLTQLPPFLHFRSPCLPGTVVTGRIPIHIWPRRLMWAFEWHDTSQDLVLTRGEPWFYVKLDAESASRPVRLIEAQATHEVSEFCAGLDGVAGLVNRTYSLFSIAKRRRPKKLVFARRRS